MKNKRSGFRKSAGDWAFDIFNYFVMILVIVIVLYPLLHIVAISFSDDQFIIRREVDIIPRGFNLGNYSYIFNDSAVYTGYRNSIFYALASTVIMLAATSLMAYPLTVQTFPLKKFVTIFLSITMFFGGGLIPTYILLDKTLHMIDTPWVMILPGTVSAMNVFMFRTFFNNVPHELRESAYLDGLGDFKVMIYIILPLSKALLATFSLFTIVGVWNSWFNGLVYLKSENLYPLQLVLRSYLFKLNANDILQRAGAVGASGGEQVMRNMQVNPKGVQMAMIVVSMFPIMMTYPFFQKYFVKGVMIGAIKG